MLKYVTFWVHMKNNQADRVFFALAHIARRQMLDLLFESPGMSVNALSSHFDFSRISVMKHLRVLEEAELVLSKKVGRTRHLFFNHVPIQMIHDRWTTQYSQFWSEQLVDIKTRIENRNANEESKSA